jgi:hypothetical protein
MGHGAFRQADMERIIRAAKSENAAVQVDLRTLVVTVIPEAPKQKELDERIGHTRIIPLGNLAPDGKDNFDEN